MAQDNNRQFVKIVASTKTKPKQILIHGISTHKIVWTLVRAHHCGQARGEQWLRVDVAQHERRRADGCICRAPQNAREGHLSVEQDIYHHKPLDQLAPVEHVPAVQKGKIVSALVPVLVAFWT